MRNYKCPKCGGEFNEWDDKALMGDIIDNVGESIIAHATHRQVCPFCGLERGNYVVPAFKPVVYGTQTEIRTMTGSVCPICQADLGKGEQCCLSVHCSDDSKKHGGSGAVFVSCPCPRCTPRV